MRLFCNLYAGKGLHLAIFRLTRLKMAEASRAWSLPIWCLSFCIPHGIIARLSQSPFSFASKARQSLLSRVRERGLWIELIAIAESVCTSQRPSLEIEVFFLTYRRCSKIYIIIPVMFSLTFLTAILIDSDVCTTGFGCGRLGLFQCHPNGPSFLFYLCSCRKLLLGALPFAKC
jgi:hypothetical protein